MIADLRRLSKALLFAAEAHRNQRRKGAAQEPYLNHLIEVLDLVVDATGDTDMDMVIAALLHDVVEDTPTTYEDIAASFGERVAEIVRENSDNMSLPKAERRRARIDAMALKSREARIVKMRTSFPTFALLLCPRRPAGPRSANLAISRVAGNWSMRAGVRKLQSSESSMRRRQMSSAQFATMLRFLSTAARWWRAILIVRSARLCISSICPIPRAALWKPRRLTAYASSSGRDSPRPQFSRPRQFTRAGDDRFSSPALEPTAPMPSLILLNASVSLSIRILSVSRSEDDISEFMETIPLSVIVRMPAEPGRSLSRTCRESASGTKLTSQWAAAPERTFGFVARCSSRHSRFVALLSQPERFLDAPRNPQSLLAVLSGEASPDPPSSGVTLLPELLITRQRCGVHSGAKTSVLP